MNVIGGHFLDEDIACFDAPFFGISRNEAKVSKPRQFIIYMRLTWQAMDPQQRLQLESAYEALENGKFLDRLRHRANTAKPASQSSKHPEAKHPSTSASSTKTTQT